MAATLLALVMLVTSAGFPAYAQEAASGPTRDARVTDAFGQVTIAPAENPKAPVPVDEDTPLKEEDIVATGPKGQAELTMDGETVIRIQPSSRFKVLKIYPNNTQFEVSQGGILAKVKPVQREDEAIIVKLPTAVVAIRGTELGAETADGVTHVGVFDEGHVAVAGAWGHEHVLLGPNQETHVPLSNVPVPAQPLYRFKGRRAQMAHVRLRQAYWRDHWEPMGPMERKRVRDRINSAVRFPVKGFRHSATTMPKPIARHLTSTRQPARKRAAHPSARHNTRRSPHRATSPSARRSTSSGRTRARARHKTYPANP